MARTAEEAIATFDEAGIGRLDACWCGWPTTTTRESSPRHASLAELGLVGRGRDAAEVVDALVARLLTMDSATLEVAHEALLTAWPRLAEWLADDAVGRAVRRHSHRRLGVGRTRTS